MPKFSQYVILCIIISILLSAAGCGQEGVTGNTTNLPSSKSPSQSGLATPGQLTPASPSVTTPLSQPSPQFSPSPTPKIDTIILPPDPASEYETQLTLDDALKNGKPTLLELGSPT